MNTNLQDGIYYESPDGKFNITMSLRGERIFFCKVVGAEEIESTKFIIGVLRDFHQTIGKHILVYADVTDVKGLTAASRTMWFKELWGNKQSIADKFALTGVNFFLRTVVNMFAKISNVPIRSFATDEQAMAWLNS